MNCIVATRIADVISISFICNCNEEKVFLKEERKEGKKCRKEEGFKFYGSTPPDIRSGR